MQVLYLFFRFVQKATISRGSRAKVDLYIEICYYVNSSEKLI